MDVQFIGLVHYSINEVLSPVCNTAFDIDSPNPCKLTSVDYKRIARKSLPCMLTLYENLQP